MTGCSLLVVAAGPMHRRARYPCLQHLLAAGRPLSSMPYLLAPSPDPAPAIVDSAPTASGISPRSARAFRWNNRARTAGLRQRTWANDRRHNSASSAARSRARPISADCANALLAVFIAERSLVGANLDIASQARGLYSPRIWMRRQVGGMSAGWRGAVTQVEQQIAVGNSDRRS